MPWFFNTVSGELTHVASGLVGDLISGPYRIGLGWHELKVASNATEAVAAADATKEFPNAPAPTTSLSKGLSNEPAGVASAVTGTNYETLILRVGEILLGIVLIGVGVAKITGTENVISTAAKTAGKAALL